MSSVCRVASLHSAAGSNLSDHVPLTLTLECSGPVVRAPTLSCAFAQRQAWYKTSEDDFIRYKIEVEKCMASLNLEDHIVDCYDPSCSTHLATLDEYASHLVRCLVDAAWRTIPKTTKSRHIAGWSEIAKPLKEQSMFWTRIWRECGYPSSGVVSVIHKKAKAKYKYAVRRLHRRQNHLRREVLAKALCSDSSRDFWTEVKRFEGRSTRGTSGVIDGTSGSASIADLWAGKFEALLNTKNPEGRERLWGQISTALNPSILGNLCVTDVQVMTAVRKLKRAKSDGRQLLSDNVINAPSSFFLALARLFTAILRHGHIPICMRDAILQPIPKGGGKDQSCSANYRGIALHGFFTE